jgi:hypothetical protein
MHANQPTNQPKKKTISRSTAHRPKKTWSGYASPSNGDPRVKHPEAIHGAFPAPPSADGDPAAGLGRGSNGNGGRARSSPACRVPDPTGLPLPLPGPASHSMRRDRIRSFPVPYPVRVILDLWRSVSVSSCWIIRALVKLHPLHVVAEVSFAKIDGKRPFDFATTLMIEYRPRHALQSIIL